MLGHRATLALALCACSQTVITPAAPDPYPDAERLVWRVVLAEEREPPTTLYVPRNYTPGDGAFIPIEWTVLVDREPDTAPADSFLCFGYRLAHLSQPFDVFATAEQFELDDVNGWRAYEEGCRSALSTASPTQ